MSLEPEQIERVREIIGYTSLEAAAVLAGNLTSVQEAETVADINEWATVRGKFTKIEGGKLGIVVDKSIHRLAIRNRVRERLGLFRLTSEDDLSYTQDGPEFAIGCPLEDCNDFC